MHILYQGKSICLYNKSEALSKRDGVAGGNFYHTKAFESKSGQVKSPVPVSLTALLFLSKEK